MTDDATRERLRLWLRLLAATTEMEKELRRRLRAEFDTTLPRFDVMAALDRAPAGLSMGELSRRLMVTNGNTTVLVAGLERDGLVRRSVSPSDRRSFTVELTAAGRELFGRLADAHATWVGDLLGDVDDDAGAHLSRLLHDARLAIQARAGASPAPSPTHLEEHA
jgi:DNA-binding MarR family transcriptional regulator